MRLLILIFQFVLCSCTSYRYYTLNSSLPEKNPAAFTFENDTLSLTYTFSGNGGPVQIDIANKLNVPLIIDWKKSSIIVDGYIRPYWKDESTFDATNYSFSISGVITKPADESFIPPNASLQSRWVQVMPYRLNFSPDTDFNRIVYNGVSMEMYTFSADNSPFAFRSYLSFRLDEESDYFHYDHHFWVTRIYQSISDPNSLLPPHHFYTSEPTGAGAVLGVLTLGGIIWIAVETD